MKTELTICIPTRNRAEYLGNCLLKLLEWIPEDWKILVGDNASSCSTLEVVQSFPGVQWIKRPENIGAEANLFDLYKRADGEFVTYLADDDELEPEAFLAAFEALKLAPKAPALYAPWLAVDKVEGTSRAFYTLPQPLPATPLGLFKMICLGSVLPEIGIYRREAALKAFELSPFAYWAFLAYGNFRLQNDHPPLLSPKPFYRNIIRHYEGEQRRTLGTQQAVTKLGEYRGGLEYLLGVMLEEEGRTGDIDAVRDGQLWISSFMSGRVEVAARLSGDPVLQRRLLGFGGRG